MGHLHQNHLQYFVKDVNYWGLHPVISFDGESKSLEMGLRLIFNKHFRSSWPTYFQNTALEGL